MLLYRLDVPPSLPINIGDVTPVPKGPGARAWSTISNNEVIWDGTKWMAYTASVAPPPPTVAPTAPGIAIFMGGAGNLGALPGISSILNYVGIYTFATDVMATGANLLIAVDYATCVGNGVQAICCGGGSAASWAINTTAKYTYATNVIVVGSNLTAIGAYGSGASNSAIGISASSASGPNVTNLIMYASGIFVAGSTLATGPWDGCATGIATDAMFMGGYLGGTPTNSIVDYNYASNTNVLMTVVTSYSTLNRAAGGNSTMAVVVDGQSGTAELVNYAANSVVFGSSLASTGDWMAGASSSTTAIFAGGLSVNTGVPANTVSLYSYASSIVTTAATLGAYTQGTTATAPNSGVNY